jgi:hypothetical protein
MISNTKIIKKYYKPLMLFILTGIITYFILHSKVIKNISHYDKRKLDINDIKTGDLFLLSYTRNIHLLVNAMLGMNFTHPSIALWEDGKLFMVEYAEYPVKYDGFLKIPFEEWIRFNKNTVILKNSLFIKNDSIIKREILANNILNTYYNYKEKFNNFDGNFNLNMYRFFLKYGNYKSIEKYKNPTCTEILAFLICESGIAKKTKSLEYYQPSKFIGFSGFDLNEEYNCKENYIIDLK